MWNTRIRFTMYFRLRRTRNLLSVIISDIAASTFDSPNGIMKWVPDV